MNSRIGVCSWSLQATSPTHLVELVQQIGLQAVQLALDPLRTGEWSESGTIDALNNAGIRIASGMMGTVGEDYSTLDTIKRTGGVRLDEHWSTNHQAARDNAQLASRLGLSLVTLHAGFLPHDASDPVRRVMIERLSAIIDCFAEHDIAIGFETGQETAATLIEVLAELNRPTVGVNFDPANMILYGMGDPISALKDLAPHVRQIHIKDAGFTKDTL